ncbi:MAG: transcriptional regulator [Geminicoccaceae bacterium]
MITGLQVRLARAALDWSVIDLAEHAHININMVVRFENDGNTDWSIMIMLRDTLEANGVEFIWQDDKQGNLFSPPPQEA